MTFFLFKLAVVWPWVELHSGVCEIFWKKKVCFQVLFHLWYPGVHCVFQHISMSTLWFVGFQWLYTPPTFFKAGKTYEQKTNWRTSKVRFPFCNVRYRLSWHYVGLYLTNILLLLPSQWLSILLHEIEKFAFQFLHTVTHPITFLSVSNI